MPRNRTPSTPFRTYSPINIHSVILTPETTQLSSINTRFTPHFGNSAGSKLPSAAKRAMETAAESNNTTLGPLKRLSLFLPITSKLNPFNGKNLEYLLISATITRFLVALARSEENRPKRLKTSEMSPIEKKKAFAERCFIEFFGTTVYITLLHLGQDLSSKIIEKLQPNLITEAKAQAIKEIKAGQGKVSVEDFSKAFDKIYGTSTKGLVSRILYGEKKSNGEVVQGIRRKLCEELEIPLKEANDYLPDVMNRAFRTKANILCTVAVLSGVAISASIGGYGIQWLNDNAFSKYLRKKYPESTPAGFLTLPSSDPNNLSFTSNPFQMPPSSFSGGTL